MYSKSIFLSLLVVLLTSTSGAQPTYTSQQLAVIANTDSILPLIGRHNEAAFHQIDSSIISYQTKGDTFGIGRLTSLRSWACVFSGDYKDGLNDAYEAFKIQQHIKDSVGLAKTFNRIGILKLQLEKYGDASRFFRKSLDLFVHFNDSLRIDMLVNNIGVVYDEKQEPDSAIYFYKQSLAIRKKLSSPHWIAYSHYNIGSSYMGLPNLDSAKFYLLEAERIFSQESEKKEVPAMVLMGIGEYYGKMNNLPLAISYQEKGLGVAEDWQQKELMLEGRALLANSYYEAGEYQLAFDLQKEWQQLKQELDSTNNATELAKLEHEFQNVLDQQRIVELRNENLEVSKKLQRMLIISILVLSLLTLGTLAFWFKNKEKTNAQELREAGLQTRLSELKLLALKAQMNPHFIFNCINTIQHFVLDAKPSEAYEYLSKFARLLRLVLEHSESTYIPLDDEIEEIKLYLELESIRFENSFDFEIELDEALREGVFMVPSMMIQPLVENALLHGLLNLKDKKGMLLIHFELLQDKIQVTVRDNGIGREAAEKIKSQKAIHYQSKALPNIEHRLHLMQEESQQSLPLEITDLIRDGLPLGTEVKLQFPFK